LNGPWRCTQVDFGRNSLADGDSKIAPGWCPEAITIVQDVYRQLPAVVVRVPRHRALDTVPRVTGGSAGLLPGKIPAARIRFPTLLELRLDIAPFPVLVTNTGFPALPVRWCERIVRNVFVVVVTSWILFAPVRIFSGGINSFSDPFSRESAGNSTDDRPGYGADGPCDGSGRSTCGCSPSCSADSNPNWMRAGFTRNGIGIGVAGLVITSIRHDTFLIKAEHGMTALSHVSKLKTIRLVVACKLYAENPRPE
jgi:hypothetical protein